MKINRTLKIILVNALVFLVGLVLIELFLGGWFSRGNQLKNLGIMQSVELTYDVGGLYSSSAPITYSRDDYGLRGACSFDKPHEIDILSIGGSTTDQRYIDDEGTWQSLLAAKFKEGGREICISNAGIDGQSTIGHLKNFELWFPHVEGLRPRYIMFYIGINDVYSVVNKNHFDDLNSTRNLIRNNSVLYNLMRKLKGIKLARDGQLAHGKIEFKEEEYVSSGVASEGFYRQYEKKMDDFSSRLEVLCQYTKEMGAQPIFVTQPDRRYQWDGDVLLGYSSLGTLMDEPFNGVDYHRCLSMINARITSLAKREGLALVELTDTSIWEDGDFYDWCHNTPQGTKKLVGEIYRQIGEELVFD
jgi:hypothetical protein